MAKKGRKKVMIQRKVNHFTQEKESIKKWATLNQTWNNKIRPGESTGPSSSQIHIRSLKLIKAPIITKTLIKFENPNHRRIKSTKTKVPIKHKEI